MFSIACRFFIALRLDLILFVDTINVAPLFHHHTLHGRTLLCRCARIYYSPSLTPSDVRRSSIDSRTRSPIGTSDHDRSDSLWGACGPNYRMLGLNARHENILRYPAKLSLFHTRQHDPFLTKRVRQIGSDPLTPRKSVQKNRSWAGFLCSPGSCLRPSLSWSPYPGHGP